MVNTKISFWLIPSEEDRVFFQRIIDNLAQEYDAPSFTPHVTIYSGEYTPDDNPAEVIDQSIKDIKSFSLKVEKLGYTEEFTKTLFVQFSPCATLSQISETIRSRLSKPSQYILNPHLSLIYRKLNETIKKNLTNSLSLNKSEVFFNEVRAISTPALITNKEDVENWQTICTRKLQNYSKRQKAEGRGQKGKDW
ncbi:MAG: cyclic phosphodiesterase-like protein [Symploca sp. SIO1A3]|nr:cyclic phosphodiesterase-like protein [Symploca sp. SIO1A3]